MSEHSILTLREAAELLRVHPATVRREVERGHLPCLRVGNRLRFRRVDLLARFTA